MPAGGLVQWTERQAASPTVDTSACICEVLLAARLAYLTKAATLPFAALIVVVGIGRAAVGLRPNAGDREFRAALAAPVSFAAAFLLVACPCIATSKRVHGQYFYNVNSAALVWYDGYPEAAAALASYGPNGWPPGPRSMRPGLRKSWRDHSLAQIVGRLDGGFRDMAAVSFRDYMFLKPLVCPGCSRRRRCQPPPDRLALAAPTRSPARRSSVAYAALYLPAIAFYEPDFGTGTWRFLRACCPAAVRPHDAADPSRRRHAAVACRRRLAPHRASLPLADRSHADSDLVFVLPHRLMTTYGGV